MRSPGVSVYHVTVLSNFARAYDKYQRIYRKSAILESTYPDEFYVLPPDGLRVGVDKATRLRDKLGVPGDSLLALHAVLPPEMLRPNLRNGAGFVWPSPDLPVAGLHAIDPSGELVGQLSFEEATARSLALHASEFAPYGEIRPRSLSFLPIAKGCQAACPFCFSEASASLEQEHVNPDWESVRTWVRLAHDRGAERAVITGGGEPTLLARADLVRFIQICRSVFDKVVLITNGVTLARLKDTDAAAHLKDLHSAGLSVLAVSRHHPSEAKNAKLMNIETHTPALLRACVNNLRALPGLRVRLICVLQRGGVESVDDIDRYVRWAVSSGVHDVCFKELYVSTSHESVYHSRQSNEWSAQNQVPLSLVHHWAEVNGLRVSFGLPWGAPIFGGVIDGQQVRVAAYTEPSLFWERLNGIARSWNVMADGVCLASLEDRQSVIESIAVSAQ